MDHQTFDWFVAADSAAGDGSRDRPFHDLWLAMESAGPGDVIHIAAGMYFGRYDRSSWLVDCPNLTIRGGYSRDFGTRTPWKTPSVFAMFPDYEATRESNMIGWRGEHSGLTLDGVFFDAAGGNKYGANRYDGISSFPAMDGPMASFNGEGVTIRNCVFVNGANGGVELSGDGSCFENNLLLNIIGIGMLHLRSSPNPISHPIMVMNNSLCFTHDLGVPPGSGGDSAIGIRVDCPAVLEENLFVACGNAAISVSLDAARVSIGRNLFFLTPRDILKSSTPGNVGEINESNLGEMEDLGFRSTAGNLILDPVMTGLEPGWVDAYSRHLLANYVRPPRETANAVRVAMGLPALTREDLEAGENKGAVAPRVSVAEALALRFAAQQGFHPAELTVAMRGNLARTELAYRVVDWSVMSVADPSLANTRVELRAGLGAEQNAMLLADAPPETHMGVRVLQPGSDDVWFYALIRRYTRPARQFGDAITYNRGMEVEKPYLLRGIYRTGVDSGRQKATLIVESIVPAPVAERKAAPRPAGRDWFVRAGASGGDGTREKPFRDPFQALDKAEGGDTVHVAGGDYYGKLRSGKWKISIRNLALLGGYDAEFAGRNPWTNATRFLLHADEKAKGRPSGPLLESEDNSDGLILDGFIFDGATRNTYSAGGSLDIDASPLAPLLSLRGGRDSITIRNCLFVNGSDGAVILSCPFGVFENNIVLNHNNCSVIFHADGPGPAAIRNNTILFAADPTPRAGTGKSNPDGSLLLLTGRAAVEITANIFAFADNFGVHSAINQQNVSFIDNVFAGNLFNHLTDDRYLWADTASWERRAVGDSAFAAFSGNTLALPLLPVEAGPAELALRRLFALPSRIAKEQWKILAARIGSSAVPDAAVSAAEPLQDIGRPAAELSLGDLLSALGSSAKKKEEPPHRGEPALCPLFDWKQALALAREGKDDLPGARRCALTVAFAAGAARPVVEYVRIQSSELDGIRASLDQKPIEIDVTELRDSSRDPSLYPAGTGRDEFAALSATAADGAARTHLALVIRLDTATSKLFERMRPRDKLRIRGTAHTGPGPDYLSIVVDSAEAVAI